MNRRTVYFARKYFCIKHPTLEAIGVLFHKDAFPDVFCTKCDKYLVEGEYKIIIEKRVKEGD